MVELDDWVLLFGRWERVNSIVYKATEHQGIVVESINDVKINTPEKFFNDTNHRPLKGPFKVWDVIEHKNYGKDVVAGFDSHGYVICKHLTWTVLAKNCELVTPVEAFEKKEEKTFEEAVAEHFRKGLESYKNNSSKLEKAKTLIETTIAPKTYMGTPEWTALTTVWAILLEVTGEAPRLIHGKVKDYITIPLPYPPEREITNPTTDATLTYSKHQKKRIENLKDRVDQLTEERNTLQTQYDGLRQSLLEMKEKLESIS